MKNIASALIDGSTMYDIKDVVNKQLKEKFKGDFDVYLKTSSKYKGRIYLSVGERISESEYKPVIEFFRRIFSHMVLEVSKGESIRNIVNN